MRFITTLCFGLFIPLAANAGSVSFSISSDSISGSAGSLIGFGYTITNTTAYYYQPTALNSNAFSVGTPTFVFDYPEVAPGATVTESFNSATLTGLFEITLGGTAGQSDSGEFVLSGEYYNDFAETMDAGAAPDLTAGYTVSIAGPTGVPEPSSLVIFAAGLPIGLLFLARRSRRTHSV